MNKAGLIKRIAELVNERKLDGIADLRDESDREGIRIVIDLKRDAVAEVLLNQLYFRFPQVKGHVVHAELGECPRRPVLQAGK